MIYIIIIKVDHGLRVVIATPKIVHT